MSYLFFLIYEGCSTEIERYSEELGNCVIFLYRGLSQETPYGIEEYCCKTLRKINDQKCRCEAISKMVKSIKEAGGGSRWRSLSEEQRRKLIQSAASLPSTCKLQHGCQIQSSSAAVF